MNQESAREKNTSRLHPVNDAVLKFWRLSALVWLWLLRRSSFSSEGSTFGSGIRLSNSVNCYFFENCREKYLKYVHIYTPIYTHMKLLGWWCLGLCEHDHLLFFHSCLLSCSNGWTVLGQLPLCGHQL